MFYFILSLPLLLALLKLGLTNILIPYSHRNKLLKQLHQRSEWPTISQKNAFLEALYRRVHAKSSSQIYRLVHWLHDKEFIYGEIDFLSFYTLLEQTKPEAHEVFYDLGSGAGKAVLSAMIFFNLQRAIGIELLPPLYKKACSQSEKAKQLAKDMHKEYLTQLERTQWINSSFLEYDFSDADILYIAATTLNENTWNELVRKMMLLKPGSRVIVATRSIQDEHFELIYQGVDLMSWGLCPVRIYRRGAQLSF